MPPIVAAKEFKEKDREMEERARRGREWNEIAVPSRDHNRLHRLDLVPAGDHKANI